MPAKPVLRRVTITYEVLAPMDVNPASFSLNDIAAACMDGCCSGHFISTTTDLLSKKQAIKACEAQGTDPEFFGL